MFPRWISWMVFLAMGYLIFNATQVGTSSSTVAKPLVPPITETNYPALAEATDVERWKRSLDPDYAARMNCTLDAPKGKQILHANITEIAAGAGDAAACGDSITIRLTVWGANGEKSYDDDVTLALGSRELAAGLDHGLVGIKPGGERLLVLPPYTLVRNAKAKALPAVKALPLGKLAVVTVKRLK